MKKRRYFCFMSVILQNIDESILFNCYNQYLV